MALDLSGEDNYIHFDTLVKFQTFWGVELYKTELFLFLSNDDTE